MTSKADDLISQLQHYGVILYEDASGVRAKLPNPVPPEAIPLLKQLKAALAEPWDGEKIIQAYIDMLARQNKRYPKGALEFAYSDRPDLVKALQAAEESYTQAWHKRDMAGCRKALPAIETAIAKIIQAYELEQGLWPPGRD